MKMGETKNCKNCSKEFETDRGREYCAGCIDDIRMEQLGEVEEPEGGWPRNSDIDRL